jgi:hypothetical protein
MTEQQRDRQYQDEDLRDLDQEAAEIGVVVKWPTPQEADQWEGEESALGFSAPRTGGAGLPIKKEQNDENE